MKPTRIPEVWDARWFGSLWDQMRPLLDRLHFGAGSPEGVVTAELGHLYLRTDGGASTTLYVKTADAGAATGWTAK